jgi:hypothetical protein
MMLSLLTAISVTNGVIASASTYSGNAFYKDTSSLRFFNHEKALYSLSTMGKPIT